MENEYTGSAVFNLLSDKNKKRLIAAAALGVVMVMLSSLFSGAKQRDEKTDNVYSVLVSDYCSRQEERLETILSSIEGVGRSKVMLTLENGVEYRYAADEKLSDDSVFTYADGNSNPSKVQQSENSEQNYILIGSSGDKKPLVVTEISPRVKAS